MDLIKRACLGLLASLAATTGIVAPASAQQPQKPNILVIMGDDVGYWNISAYNRGQMGYRTPNIDRIASVRCQPRGAETCERTQVWPRYNREITNLHSRPRELAI